MATKRPPCADWGLKRRDFLTGGALLGGAALAASHTKLGELAGLVRTAEAKELPVAAAYPRNKPENILYTTCLQCQARCTLKVKVVDGIVVKIDGNPYGPQTMLWPVAYATPPEQAAAVDGKVCPKGQSGVQTIYDPYRIRKVLKRAGPRGSNRWVSIPFDQAVREIVDGGVLFKAIPGEQARRVPGLRDLWALRDAKVAGAMAADAAKLGKKQMSVAEFKAKHAANLSALSDPDHPDLGPKNNQFVFLAGRINTGRNEFSKRWLSDGFGSINWFEHTAICEISHHVANQYVTAQYDKGAWKPNLADVKPDLLNAEFVLYFGTGCFEANFGPTYMAQKVTDGLASGRLKIAVADPRQSKTASVFKSWKWLPVKPGGDGALALSLARWIIDNSRHDARFLRNANKAAASADGEPSWSNATWLVRIEADGRPGAFLRAKDIGLGDEHTFVALQAGSPVPVRPYDDATPVEGELLADTTIQGIRAKTAFQLLWESAASRTLAEWEALSGIAPADVEAVGRELTGHGKKAGVESYRGAVKHTYGFYNQQMIQALNLLIGNPDWKGGMARGGGGWEYLGGRDGKPFRLSALHPDKTQAFGVKLTREGSRYEESTLFTGYPAKRPWYPFTGNLFQEVIPAAEAGYPYPVKALFMHMATPVYSTPAGQLMIPVLRDLGKLPLVFACDIVIGESSMYADYVFPDLTYLERWESIPGTTPDILSKATPIRQPVAAPIPEEVTVFGERMPISMEAIMLAIAERLGLSGFGPDGFGRGMPLSRSEQFYLKLIANVAAGDGPGNEVPEADAAEVELFSRARRHLPPSVWDPAKWQQAVGERWWKKVIYVMNRGGRFDPAASAFKGEQLASRVGSLFNLYLEPIATARNSMTGKFFSGTPIYEPVRDAMGRDVVDAGYDLQLITFKEITATQSRTAGVYWSQLLYQPENFVLLNSREAERLGLKEGDRVRLNSASNPRGEWDLGNGRRIPLAGKVKPIEGLRPGVVAVSHHYGHWAYGASDIVVDGRIVKGDRRRGTGLQPTGAMRADEYLKNVTLIDPIGGSAAFFDTRVRLVRA
ncbi:MAG TPA: molybdopterin dinucleotide binding domain-containing protein [Casimicrobiaceae bacterium]